MNVMLFGAGDGHDGDENKIRSARKGLLLPIIDVNELGCQSSCSRVRYIFFLGEMITNPHPGSRTLVKTRAMSEKGIHYT